MKRQKEIAVHFYIFKFNSFENFRELSKFSNRNRISGVCAARCQTEEWAWLKNDRTFFLLCLDSSDQICTRWNTNTPYLKYQDLWFDLQFSPTKNLLPLLSLLLLIFHFAHFIIKWFIYYFAVEKVAPKPHKKTNTQNNGVYHLLISLKYFHLIIFVCAAA